MSYVETCSRFDMIYDSWAEVRPHSLSTPNIKMSTTSTTPVRFPAPQFIALKCKEGQSKDRTQIHEIAVIDEGNMITLSIAIHLDRKCMLCVAKFLKKSKIPVVSSISCCTFQMEDMSNYDVFTPNPLCVSHYEYFSNFNQPYWQCH